MNGNMPGGTSSNQNQFYYTYVLQSLADGKRYIGMTTDLRRRFQEHQMGKSLSTAPRRPFKLIYYEAVLSYEDAERRERYLKTTDGRRFLAKRLRHYLAA